MYDDALTRNDDGELAVRTVQATGDNPASSYDDVFTRDNNGKLAVRVVGLGGGGGGDSHNLGWYATPQALNEAHPTAEDGDWAIVGSTDTVWVWDSDTTAWKDTDQKGQVTSVNGQTGAVTVQETLVSGTNIKTINNNSILGSGNLDIDGLPTQTGQSGKFLTTDGSSASWATVDALPSQTGQSGKVLGTNGTTASWETPTTITFRTWGANE